MIALLSKKINRTEETTPLNTLELFIILNPLFDIVATIGTEFLQSSIPFSMILRAFFVLFMIYELFKSDEVEIGGMLRYFIIAIVYSIIYLNNIYKQKGFQYTYLETVILAKALYLPLFTIVFAKYSQWKGFRKKTIYISSLMYMSFLFFPNILGFGLPTYSYEKGGLKGWFSAANEIGAILGILTPYFLKITVKNTKGFIKYLLLLIWTTNLFMIGTKVPVISLLITIFYRVYRLLLNRFRNSENIKKDFLIGGFLLFVVSIFLTYIISQTTFFNNMVTQINWFSNNQDSTILQIIINLIFSSRTNYLVIAYVKYKLSPIPNKLFGLGLHDVYGHLGRSAFISEMDIFDIFFVFGVIGFIIVIAPLLYYVFDFIIQRRKGKKDNNSILVLAIAFLVSLFAGHVFMAPAVSYLIPVFLCSNSQFINSKINSMRYDTMRVMLLSTVMVFTYLITSNMNFPIDFDFYERDNYDSYRLIDNGSFNRDSIEKIIINDLNITISSRNLSDNKDKIHFVKVENKEDNIKGLNINFNRRTSPNKLIDFSEGQTRKEYDPVVGQDFITSPNLYLEDNKGSMLLSKPIAFKELKNRFNHDSASYLSEYISENDEWHVSETEFVIPLYFNGGDVIEFFVIESDVNLFESEEEVSSFIDKNNIKSYSWLTEYGNKSKLPYTVIPGTEKGYGLVPGLIAADELDYSNGSKIERILIKNSIYTILNKSKKTVGVFSTDYALTWLVEDYTIYPPYANLQDNLTILNFLMEYYGLIPEIEISDIEVFAKYMISNDGAHNNFSFGKLPKQYFNIKKPQDSSFSSSFIQSANYSSYLFDLYKISSKKIYYDQALSVSTALEDSMGLWLDESGILNYEIFNDGTLKYSENSYLEIRALEELFNMCLNYDFFNLNNNSFNKALKENYLNLKSRGVLPQKLNEDISNYIDS